MNIEIRKDTTYTFNFTKLVNYVASDINTAIITIKLRDGSIPVNNAPMTINGNVAVYDYLASSDYSNRNTAELIIDGIKYIKIFDIVYCPFVCTVTDNEIFLENDRLRTEAEEYTGVAESGSSTKLIDSEINVSNGFYNGGEIKIWSRHGSEITTHSISSFASQTFTFTPARVQSVSSGCYYSVRRSYTTQIQRASDVVMAELQRLSVRPYMILGSDQMNDIIVYKFFERYYQQLRKSEGDEFDLQYLYYRDKYNDSIKNIQLIKDINNDGIIDDESSLKFGNIRFKRS